MQRANETDGLSKAMKVLEEILQSDRYQRTFGSVHASQTVYADEPILKTGRQMERRQTEDRLPERIRKMKAMSRYQPGKDGAPGRWLSEGEFFWRQGTFMEDFEDNYPYHGTFKAYYPTYDAMSDQQLRGYFTWRAQVRRGRIEETSPSFVFVYLYELICGIGVREPAEGFRIMAWIWQSCRSFAPELDRYARIWLQDYVVYHGLSPELLAPCQVVEFDHALTVLRRAAAQGTETAAAVPRARGTGHRAPASALPLPADEAMETELFDALDTLSTYRLKNARLYKAEPAALRHVACAVYVRTSAYYDKHRKTSTLESWFGRQMEQSYVMFGSAVFFEPERHADCVYELDEAHRYRCERGLWTCKRYHGSRQRSGKLGQIMRAVDRTLRVGLGFAHPLKDDGKTPKYQQKIIDEEVAAWTAWLAWQEANRPRRIDIDLSQLAGIRQAAAGTREALLVDEERELPGDGGRAAALDGAENTVRAARMVDVETSVVDGAGAPNRTGCNSTMKGAPAAVPTGEQGGHTEPMPTDAVGLAGAAVLASAGESAAAGAATGAFGLAGTAGPAGTGSGARAGGVAATAGGTAGGTAAGNKADTGTAMGRQVGAAAGNQAGTDAPSAGLTPEQTRYLRALLVDGGTAERAAAVRAAGLSEDLLVDAVNEALFDAMGDTVVEFGPDGPALVEDYMENVQEVLGLGAD